MVDKVRNRDGPIPTDGTAEFLRRPTDDAGVDFFDLTNLSADTVTIKNWSAAAIGVIDKKNPIGTDENLADGRILYPC